jgi:hypothetical protein
MRYAKVLAQSVHEDFDMIETILTNKQNEKVPIYLAADADSMPAG